MDFEEINKIIKLLEDKNLAEFELEIEGFKIKIGRNYPAAFNNRPSFAGAGPVDAYPAAGTGQDSAAEAKGESHAVLSPMVGTFYRAPSPSSPPFVEIGDVVKKKQTLCIVEAMKLMNEIESDADGVIKDIYVENGKPVEFGQKLFLIVPQA
ncbi:MAG: acetyl-CoA carboxylase biotin carboxyl carrier protein [Candidatus Aminicenantes bacterium]|nr:acetyl-CoA carboxylase biotin carboxyl carrier protein [Candidatus Aminicenantes bacterium]